MKKAVFFLGCLALLVAGCNKGQTVEELAEEVPQLKFNITANFVDDTRAVKKGWDVGDKIYLAFDVSFLEEVGGLPTNHGYVTMTFNGNTFDTPQSSDANFMKALLKSPSGKLAAVYLSSNQTPELVFDDQSSGSSHVYAFSVKDRYSLGGYILSSNEVDYTISDNILTAELNLTLNPSDTRIPVHFFLPSVPEEEASHYTLSCAEFSRDAFTAFLYLQSFSVGPEVLQGLVPSSDYPIRGSYYDGGVEFVGFLNPENKGVATHYLLVITDDQGTLDDTSDDIVYTVPRFATLKGKEAFNLPVLSSPRWGSSNAEGTRGTYNGHEWVLMADGNKWATMNVAADETYSGRLVQWKDAQKTTDELWGTGWRIPTHMDWINLLSHYYHLFSPYYYGDNPTPSDFAGWNVTVMSNFNLEMEGNTLSLARITYLEEDASPTSNPGGYYWCSDLVDGIHPYALRFNSETRCDFVQDMSPNCWLAVRVILDDTAPVVDVNFDGYRPEIEW